MKKIIAFITSFLNKLFSYEDDTRELMEEIEAQAESVEPFDYGLSYEEKDMSFRMNVSEGQANYSQRKSKYYHEQKGQYGVNILDWRSVCNCHSLAMAFLYSGWAFPRSVYEREPDALVSYIIEECLKENNWFKEKMYVYWHNWYEGDPKAPTPVEFHDVLAHYACEYFKCTNADKFRTDATVKEIFKYMYKNRVAIPTSVEWGGLQGHVVCIVGFEATSEADLLKWFASDTEGNPITKVIVDDPWGKLSEATNTYDGGQSGNDNEFNYTFFERHWKPVGSRLTKWVHFINRPAVLC